jgi:hypothetical protein
MKKAVIAGLIVSLAVIALAQEKAQEDVTRKLMEEQKITIRMMDASLAIVIDQFATLSELNIVLDPGVGQGLSVSLNLQDVSFKTALETALEPHGLDYIIKKSGLIYVATKERIAEMRGQKDRPPEPVEAGYLLLLLKDGSRLKGKLEVEKWVLETAYGRLEIPANEIVRVRLPHETQECEKALTEDEVETVRFTVTGRLEVGKLEVDTGKGKLTIPKGDIKTIWFPTPCITKSFELKPDGEWLDTGIRVEKGVTLVITAEGSLEWIEKMTFGPDGGFESPTGLWKEWSKEPAPPWLEKGFPLMAKVGEGGKPFKAGSSYEGEADSDGELCLIIEVADSAKPVAENFKGSYRIDIRIRK